MDKVDQQVVRHELGFFSLRKKPTENELKQYYEKKYYQEESGGYRSKYSEEEIKYFNSKNEQKFQIISELGMSPLGQQFLDIGCGEGYMLDFFRKKNWNVLGLDYSNYGCSQMNPDCIPFLNVGDIYENLKVLLKRKKKFDVINLMNVLEHVLEPEKLLNSIRHIAHDDTILLVTVPNDFSFYQNFLLQENLIDHPFWIAIPDHISYFEKTSLKNICNYCGWEEKMIVADFPIDLFLANPHSNYIKEKSKGAAAHQARVKLDNLFHEKSIKATIDFYKAMAQLGFGRQITGYYKLSESNSII